MKLNRETFWVSFGSVNEFYYKFNTSPFRHSEDSNNPFSVESACSAVSYTVSSTKTTLHPKFYVK